MKTTNFETNDLTGFSPDGDDFSADGTGYGEACWDPIEILAPLPMDDDRTPDFSPWTRFLLVSTVVACLIVGGVLSRLDFLFTPAKAGSQEEPLRQVTAVVESDESEPPAGSEGVGKTPFNSEGTYECLVSDRFPARVLKWCDLISQNASKRGLPPDLVAAVILQESGGNPAAYSQSGAIGLMQVMPNDGIAASFQCTNGLCFAARPSSSDLKDPAFNISYGTKLLAGLVAKNGSLRDGLRSYGPMNVGYSYADKVISLYQRYGK